jgi:hypothetical protein
MNDVLIGIVVGIVAVITAQWAVPRPAPPPEVRELSTIWGGSSLVELGKPMIPSTQPDPVAQRLAMVLDRFEYKDKTLDQVIDLLAERTGCNFFIEWPALEGSGTERDPKGTLILRNLSAAAALKLVLTDFAPGLNHLGYRVEDGIVRITTADQLSQTMVIRVYDVRDLVQTDLDRHRASDHAPDQPSDDEAGGASLAKLLEEKIEPATWRTAGGQADVGYFAGRLIVNQTPENQETINQLLAAIRRKQH